MEKGGRKWNGGGADGVGGDPGGGGGWAKLIRVAVGLGSNQLCSFHPYSSEPLSKGRLYGCAGAGIPSDGAG